MTATVGRLPDGSANAGFPFAFVYSGFLDAVWNPGFYSQRQLEPHRLRHFAHFVTAGLKAKCALDLDEAPVQFDSLKAPEIWLALEDST